MSTSDIIFLAMVFFVGLPSSLRNPTAAALVIAWCIGIAWSEGTGDNLPIKLYFVTDAAVVGVVCAKHCGPALKRTGGRLIHCLKLLQQKSWGDRIVLCIFPIMWIIYVLPMDDWPRYWLLWWLCAIQFVAAAGDALHSFFRGRTPKSASDVLPPGSYRLARGQVWKSS